MQLFLIPVAAATLPFFVIDNVERVSNRQPPSEQLRENEIDGYSEGINTVQFDAAGRVKYTLSAARQVSYRNAAIEFEEPFMQLYQGEDSLWNIVAESGRISSPEGGVDQIEEIVLSGGVEVYQLDEFGNRTVLATQLLIVDPATETLNTELLVTMVSDTLEQSAIGMRVDLRTEEYEFFREIRGRYAAAKD
jgi:LPS export ABC transporter protein LptC